MPPPINRHLVDRADIARFARVQQGTGWVEQSTPIAADVICRLMPLSGSSLSDDEKAAHLQSDVTHAVFFVPGQDIKRDDILTIRSRSFKTHNVVDDSQGGSVYRKAIVFEEQEGV